MVDGKDRTSAASPRTNDEYWERIVSVTTGDQHRRRPRSVRGGSIRSQPYHRCRPRYPDMVIDALLGPEPSRLEVLDVGCGTGIAARPMAERGAKVLGVELAPRMAEVAQRHGIDVEIGAFEEWEAAGRSFDRVTSAQAWHGWTCSSPRPRRRRCCDRTASSA